MNEIKDTNKIQAYYVLNLITEKLQDCKKIDDFERYVNMFIETYINTIGSEE